MPQSVWREPGESSLRNTRIPHPAAVLVAPQGSAFLSGPDERIGLRGATSKMLCQLFGHKAREMHQSPAMRLGFTEHQTSRGGDVSREAYRSTGPTAPPENTLIPSDNARIQGPSRSALPALFRVLVIR
jgi:hypothetical protein